VVLVVTDVAVIVGELFGAAGTVVGGVYFALKLGAAAGARVPHAGLHGEPPAVSVQFTPAFAESNCTLALSVTGAAPGEIVENVFERRTTMAGVPIPKITSAVTAALVGDAAVRTIAFGVGGVSGAIYVMDVTVL
jgi:hypothetical protein